MIAVPTSVFIGGGVCAALYSAYSLFWWCVLLPRAPPFGLPGRLKVAAATEHKAGSNLITFATFPRHIFMHTREIIA